MVDGHDPAILLIQLHKYGHLFVAFFYFAIFYSLVKKIIVKPQTRNGLAVFMVFLFFLAAAAFVSQAFVEPLWRHPLQEFCWLFLAFIPAAGVLFFRKKQGFIIGAEESLPTVERFDKLKHEFLSVASHELRTPLSVINGFAEILVREKLGPLNDEQKRRVRKILLQGQRLNHIIDELLDLSRIRSGKIEIRRDVFDLIPVLKACLDDHHIVCEQQHLNLEDHLPDLLPDVIGDLDRVTQVIVNLLNNAIKYTDPEGTITISAFQDKDGNFVQVEVADTGIGIAAEEQGKVFEEFYRASHNHAKKYSGSGLGLTIVKQLIESQGGKVGVRSPGLGEGSCFFFTLPIARNARSKGPYSKAS